MVQTQNLEPKCIRNHKKCPRLKALFLCLCGQQKEQGTPTERGIPACRLRRASETPWECLGGHLVLYQYGNFCHRISGNGSLSYKPLFAQKSGTKLCSPIIKQFSCRQCEFAHVLDIDGFETNQVF